MLWASAIAADPVLDAAIEQCADALVGRLHSRSPDLLVAFASVHHRNSMDRLASLLTEEFDLRVLVGCCAEGVIGAGEEIEEGPALSLTAAILPGVRIDVRHLQDTRVPGLYADRSVWEEAMGVSATDEPAFLLIGDPFSFNVEPFLQGLDRAFPVAVKVGGLASGARHAGETILLLDDRSYRSGLVSVALSGNIELDPLVAQGCRPIADPLFVTGTHENLIRTLDGRTPRDVLADVFDRLDATDRELFGQALFIGLSTPGDRQQVAPGDYLIRNILGLDPQSGALWIGAHAPEQSVVQFHLRDARTSARDLEQRLLAYRSSHGHPAPSAALLFSCLGRGARLYGHPHHDSNAFRHLVADVPVGGFFCSGEIGPVAGATHLHGYTSAFAVFRSRVTA